MNQTTTTSKKPDPHRWSVFACICLVYFFVYFHRVSPSVIVSDLIAAFHTNATALGLMSSMYFYLYALEQPLVGYLADRIGPRRVIGYWSMLASVGCFIFGLAPNIGWASAGRALIGLGVGGVYVPAVKSFSQWFRSKEFATMIGLLMAVGNFGAVIATTPLAWAAVALGWRATFFGIGGVTLLLALATFKFTRDFSLPADSGPPQPVKNSAARFASRNTVVTILTSFRFWLVALIFFGIYGTLITLQGLWATPFLMTALGVGRVPASNLNMLIPIGVIVGSPLIGWLTGRLSLDKAQTLRLIIVVHGLTWATIIFFYHGAGRLGLGLCLLAMGIVAGGFISTLWGVVQESTPPNILGLTSGMLNPAPFAGVAIFQVITGAILDRSSGIDKSYTMAGFKNAFLVCLVCIVVCWLLSFLLKTVSAQSD